MNTTTTLALGLFAGLGLATLVHADGYLWLGAENAGEGNAYRYDIETGMIDMVITPDDGINDHINHCAVDGQFVYIASPGSQHFGRVDGYTGELLDTPSFSSGLSGHREDGAYRRSTNTIWRMTYSGGRLYELSREGDIINNFTLNTGGLVGVAWANDVLYACHYTNGSVGTITIDGNNATYTPIPWAAGEGPNSNSSLAMAYDDCGDTLYMTNNGTDLYSVYFSKGEAYSDFIVDLDTVGYPAGALADGMGWLAPRCQADITEDLVIDVNDLLLLLASWGECGSSCDADVDCNGEVDVNDLLALLGAWGECDP